MDPVGPVPGASLENEDFDGFVFFDAPQSLVETLTLLSAHGSVVEIKAQDSDLAVPLEGYFLEGTVVRLLKRTAFHLRDTPERFFSELKGRWDFEGVRILLTFKYSEHFDPDGSVHCPDADRLKFA